MKLTVTSNAASPIAEPPQRRMPRRWLLRPFRTLARFSGHEREVEPYIVYGDCLRPWLLPDDLVWVDRGRAPQHGELVLVGMRYRRSNAMLGSLARESAIVRSAVKQYWCDAGGHLLLAADGAVYAEAHTILGVVMVVQRKPSWRAWRCIRAPMHKMAFPVPD